MSQMDGTATSLCHFSSMCIIFSHKRFASTLHLDVALKKGNKLQEICSFLKERSVVVSTFSSLLLNYSNNNSSTILNTLHETTQLFYSSFSANVKKQKYFSN